LKAQPSKLKALIKSKLAPALATWLRQANLRAQFLLEQQQGQRGETVTSRAEELQNDNNTVFEFQLPHTMEHLKASDDVDLKRYLVLIHADNTDQKTVLAALTPGIKFSMMKWSMNYGMNMYPDEHVPR
jgi:hypothetical protein